uniref:Retrovirus-related Pol polyprotein from transposon TNT 1-94 n=1 Tax=Cajanus cajan TaxID=3821 RepID=A0A151T5K7_CAJCA|nr:hypothetical protein KK1_016843 [Cajanus cajan]
MLAFVAHKNIKLYQMDVNIVFSNGIIEEGVYDKQPPGFEILSSNNMFSNLKRLFIV